LLYGPFAPPDKQINFIKLGDPNKDVSNGRAALRAEEAKDNNEQCARDTGRYKGDPKVGLKEHIALASLDQQAHRDVQTRKEAQLISIKMQLDVVGRQIEQADKKEDNAKVEELEMKEEKLSTMMATIMDPTSEKEGRPRSWNTLVEDTMGPRNGSPARIGLTAPFFIITAYRWRKCFLLIGFVGVSPFSSDTIIKKLFGPKNNA
jgi:hypothetical protein